MIDIGQLTSAHGIKGWVKVSSHTAPVENIFDYQPWYLKTQHGAKQVNLISWRPLSKGFVAKIKGVEDRNQAEVLCPATIAVDKNILPQLTKGEFYWHQLQGCRVINQFESKQSDFGFVQRIMSTGANDVLVVGNSQSKDQPERLIPYVPGQFIKKVDLDNNQIMVNWDPDF